jgi:hypothetical protein
MLAKQAFKREQCKQKASRNAAKKALKMPYFAPFCGSTGEEIEKK